MHNGEVVFVSIHAFLFLWMFYLTTLSVGKTVGRLVVEWSVKHTEMRDHTPISSMFTMLLFAWRDSSKSPENSARTAGLEFKIRTPDLPNAMKMELSCFIYISTEHVSLLLSLNTFTAIDELSRFNNSCLKSPASTLVDLTFQSRTLRSFSLNQLRNLSL